MLKMQLFELLESKEIALVNLSTNDMDENGDMKSWRLKKDKKQAEFSRESVTWSDLEGKAIVLSWSDLSEDLGVRFKEVVDEMIEASQQRKERLISSYQSP